MPFITADFTIGRKTENLLAPNSHVLFPIEFCADASLYSDMKKLVNAISPILTRRRWTRPVSSLARLPPMLHSYPGRMNLTEFLNENLFDENLPQGSFDTYVIPEGSRNATMSHFAGRVIKKYGDTDEAHQAFLEEAAKCVPPLGNAELSSIWHSAQRFYVKLSQQDGYVAPEIYNDPSCYKHRRTILMWDRPKFWENIFPTNCAILPPPTLSATPTTTGRNLNRELQAVAHELTRRQLREAQKDLVEALTKMKNSGAQAILDSTSKSKAEQSDERPADGSLSGFPGSKGISGICHQAPGFQKISPPP